MKYKIYLQITLLGFFNFSIFLSSFGNTNNDPCPSGKEMDLQELPATISTFISSNYPGVEIDDIKQYNVDGITTFRIELEGTDESELVFDTNGVLIGSFLEEDIDQSALPSQAMVNLNKLFEGMAIKGLNMEISWTGSPVYEVELSNGIEARLDMQGNMVCEEN